MLPRVRHSYDVPPPIKPWHVSTARQLYEMHGGKNVRGLEKALYFAQTHKCSPPIIRVLSTLLDHHREKVAKHQRLSWRPMR